ncbi:MAG: hypothetical protein ACI8WB_006020, partial [Phenylobacterium sp.]
TGGHIPDLSGIRYFWQPDATQLQREIAAYTSNPLDQFKQRSPTALFMQTDIFISTFLWRAGGMMLLGMALFKSGVLSGQKSNRFYAKWAIVGITSGLFISAYGLHRNMQEAFALEYSMFFGSQLNYWGSVLTALGYIGLVNLAINHGIAKRLQQRLAAVGQMAFTNYIFHSIFCTFVFYGHGFGLLGQWDRATQLLLVIAIWVLQLWYSPLWLKHFRFGPLEWLWRSLTYWQRQDMRRTTL